MVGVVAKTDDEIYDSSITKMYSYLRGSSCWENRRWCSYFENRVHHAEMAEKKTMNFSSDVLDVFLQPIFKLNDEKIKLQVLQ